MLRVRRSAVKAYEQAYDEVRYAVG